MNEFKFKGRLNIISKSNPEFWNYENLNLADNLLFDITKIIDYKLESGDVNIPLLALCKKYILNYITLALTLVGSNSESISAFLPLYEEPYKILKEASDREKIETANREKEEIEKRKQEFKSLLKEDDYEVKKDKKHIDTVKEVQGIVGVNLSGYQPKKSNAKQTPPNEGSSVIPPSSINSEDRQNMAATSNSTTGQINNESATINLPMSYGWVCPKCGRVNAPWKSTCDCSRGIAAPNTPPNTPFPLAPNYEPYIPHTPYYNPPIETPNPFDPYGPYKWGDAPGWWNQGPTCKEGQKFVLGIEYPDGHIEKAIVPIIQGDPIPCSPTVGDPTFGKPESVSNKINSQSGGDPNIKAYN